MASVKLLCQLVIIAIVASDVVAMRCYECTQCNDPFDSRQVRSVKCWGSCTKTKADGQVTRTCSVTRVDDGCGSKDNIEICFCNKDLCNSSRRNGASLAAYIVICIGLLLIKLLN